jgi:hypothetical protein
MQFEGLGLGRSRGGQGKRRTREDTTGKPRPRPRTRRPGKTRCTVEILTELNFVFILLCCFSVSLFLCVDHGLFGSQTPGNGPFLFMCVGHGLISFCFFVRSRRPGGERQKRCEGTLRGKKATAAEEVRLRLAVGGEKQNTILAMMKTKSARQFNPDTYRMKVRG